MKRNYLLGIISIILLPFLFSCVSENAKMQNRKEVFLKNSEKLNDQGETKYPYPDFPKELKAEIKGEDGYLFVRLTWKKVPWIDGYRIYRLKEGKEAYEMIGEVRNILCEEFIDPNDNFNPKETGPEWNVFYRYQIRTYKEQLLSFPKTSEPVFLSQ